MLRSHMSSASSRESFGRSASAGGGGVVSLVYNGACHVKVTASCLCNEDQYHRAWGRRGACTTARVCCSCGRGWRELCLVQGSIYWIRGLKWRAVLLVLLTLAHLCGLRPAADTQQQTLACTKYVAAAGWCGVASGGSGWAGRGAVAPRRHRASAGKSHRGDQQKVSALRASNDARQDARDAREAGVSSYLMMEICRGRALATAREGATCPLESRRRRAAHAPSTVDRDSALRERV